MKRSPAGWPGFVIGGAPKCGTTALFSYLGQHPEVFVSEPKEPHYFASAAFGRPVMRGDYDEGAYRALFAGCRPSQVPGEGSTHYLHHAEEVAPFMASKVPDVRLVFCLRNPVERAYSHFLFRHGVAGPFTPGGMGSGYAFEAFARDPEVYVMGDYAANLAVFERHFAREQVLVLLLDDLKADLPGAMARLCGHIGVDASYAFDLSDRANETEYPRWPKLMPSADLAAASLYRLLRRPRREALMESRRKALFHRDARKPALAPAQREAVAALYRPSTERLSEMIGRDLSHWR